MSLDQLLMKYLSQVGISGEKLWSSTTLVAIFVSITAVLLSTRFWTGLSSSSGNRAPKTPYFIPLVGNYMSYSWDPAVFFEQTAKQSPQGISSIVLGLYSKIVINSPSLIKEFEKDGKEHLTDMPAKVDSLKLAFGLAPYRSGAAAKALPAVLEALENQWNKNGKEATLAALGRLERHITSLVNFVKSPIDQEYWERLSNTVLLDDEETVETSLNALTQSFLTYLTVDTLLSPDYLEQKPDLAPLLVAFPTHLEDLLFKPRMISQNGVSVIRTLLGNSLPFLDAVFPGKNSSISLAYEDVEDLHTIFLEAFRTEEIKNAPSIVQNSIFLYVLLMSNLPHGIIPWALLELLLPASEGADMDPIMKELHAHVSVDGEWRLVDDNEFIPLPDVTINTDKSSQKIETLLAETIQTYSRGWSEYTVKSPFTIKDPEVFSTATGSSWEFHKDDKVVVTTWLAKDPESQPKSIEEALKQLGTLQLPFLSKFYATIYPAFISAFLKLYEVSPIPGDSSSFKPPNAKFAPGVAIPSSDVRVRIKRRRLD